MNIAFRKEFGEIESIFMSLHFAKNIEALERIGVAKGIDLDEMMRKDLIRIAKSVPKDKLDFFFSNEARIWESLVHIDIIWDCANIEEYLEAIKGLKHLEIRRGLIVRAPHRNSVIDRDIIEDIIKNKKKYTDYIKNLNISAESKWNLYCFSDELDYYVEEFVTFIKGYLPLYYELCFKYIEEYNSFMTYVKQSIEKKDFVFLNRTVNNFFSIEDFDAVRLTLSIFGVFSCKMDVKKNILYVDMGFKYNDLLRNQRNQTDYHQMIRVLSHLTDEKKFAIIKLLTEGNYFGNEVAEKVGISIEDLSNYLYDLHNNNLVHIKVKGTKVHYVLNKDTIMKSLNYLEEILEL